MSSIEAPDLGDLVEETPLPNVVVTSRGTIDGNPVVIQAVTFREVPINQSGKVPTGALKVIADQEEPLDLHGENGDPLPNADNLALAERLEGFARMLRRLDKDNPDLPPIMSFGATPSECWFQPWLPCAPITAFTRWENELSDRPDRRAVIAWPDSDTS